MKKFKPEDLKGKFIVMWDTICEGNQCAKDEDENPDPNLYDSYNDAFQEIFTDAVCGIEGNEEYFMDDEEGYDLDDPKDAKREKKDQAKRDKIISDMNALIKTKDVEKMKKFFQKIPDANYYDEQVIEAEEFILERKAIFTGNGVRMEGTKLEDL